ncbi:hypothetical protein H6F89_10215 [Cyanobacteria bacterium FACHB-63]|nr:hypothetical protein [Cyanobacteria bacterium FACHB-63]
MKRLLTATLTSAFLLVGSESAFALTTVLYNGAAGAPPNNRPNNQGWQYVDRNPFAFPPTGASTETPEPNGVVFSSISDNNILSGYGWTATPLNSTVGYNLRFDIQLLQESRNPLGSSNPADINADGKDDRAGLNILIVSSNTARAIELGFFVDQIWAQATGAAKPPRFTQAESTAFDTRTNVNRYDLSILGATYFLYANENYGTPILTGALRDYTPESTAPFPNPYRTANTIFIGDNTTAASAEFRLNQVTFTDSAITPIPFAFNPLFGFGVFGLSRLRKAIVKKTKHPND